MNDSWMFLYYILGAFIGAALWFAARIAWMRYWLPLVVTGTTRRFRQRIAGFGGNILFGALFLVAFLAFERMQAGWLTYTLFGIAYTLIVFLQDEARSIARRTLAGIDSLLSATAHAFSGVGGQLILWIGIPVAIWTVVVMVLAWWLGDGDTGFHWWDRNAWLSGTSGISKTTAEVRADELRNLLGAVALILGSLAAVFTLGNTLRRTALQDAERATNRDRLNTDAFTKAIEKLAAGPREERLGAVYSLEALAQRDTSVHRPLLRSIAEVLTDVIRLQPHPVVPQDPAASKKRADVDPVVIAAVKVMTRSYEYRFRPDIESSNGVNLGELYFPFTEMPDGTDFRRFNLDGANLMGLIAPKANFQQSKLTRCDMQLALLRDATFRGARLWFTDFRKAVLPGVDFASTQILSVNFSNAHLQAAKFDGISAGGETTFSEADLENASFHLTRFRGVNFSKATMRSADLRFSRFIECDLTNATLAGANLLFASFKGSDISGVVFQAPGPIRGRNMRAKWLTPRKIKEAKWNPENPPTWPTGFIPPHDGRPS